MDLLINHPVFATALALGVTLLLWLYKLNSAMNTTPTDALAATPHRWTEDQIRDAYTKAKTQPIDWSSQLPPKLDRRYIVVGGSGGVGGQIVLHLLQRGQTVESIRIVDLRPPARPDMVFGPASEVAFVQADISSWESTLAAFSTPWEPSVASLPLTVFHTASLISTSDRMTLTLDRVKRVNMDGAQHVLDASRASGADVLVYTSSASIALRPITLRHWLTETSARRWPALYAQFFDESDFDLPLRRREGYFGNYAYTKAVAERLICGANSPSLRTGAIRPANAVYGSSQGDQMVGVTLRAGTVPTWMPSIVQNFVHTGHVSLGHLLLESHLATGSSSSSSPPPRCAGRTFNISDPCPPPTFMDMYRAMEQTTTTPFKLVVLPPLLLQLTSYVVELCDLASRRLEGLGLGWLRPEGELAMLQPALFTASTHCIASDARARRSVQEGGLGYRGVCTTLEGTCRQVFEWNEEKEAERQEKKRKGPVEEVVEGIKNVGAVSKSIKA